MGATCGTCGGEEWSFCTKSEEERPLGFSRHVWKDNIRMHLKQVVWGA